MTNLCKTKTSHALGTTSKKILTKTKNFFQFIVALLAILYCHSLIDIVSARPPSEECNADTFGSIRNSTTIETLPGVCSGYTCEQSVGIPYTDFIITTSVWECQLYGESSVRYRWQRVCATRYKVWHSCHHNGMTCINVVCGHEVPFPAFNPYLESDSSYYDSCDGNEGGASGEMQGGSNTANEEVEQVLQTARDQAEMIVESIMRHNPPTRTETPMTDSEIFELIIAEESAASGGAGGHSFDGGSKGSVLDCDDPLQP